MTADDIRARYETAIAQGLTQCNGIPRAERQTAAVVDALDAAGLLATVHYTRVHPCDCQPCPECESAALAQGAVRQERYATAWREIPTDQGEQQ